MKHIEFANLLGQFEDHLSLENAADIQQHLDDCSTCSAEVRKLSAFFAYSKPQAAEEVGQALTARLLNIFQPKRSIELKETASGSWLIFDDWKMALNERFINTDTRQLLYKSGKYEIDIRLRFEAGKCEMSGQIFPDCGTGVAELISGDCRDSVELNEFSEFEFLPLPQGIYELQLQFEETVLQIDNIPLRS